MISKEFKKQWRLSVERYYERDGTRIPDRATTTRVVNILSSQFEECSDVSLFFDHNLEAVREALDSQVTKTSNIVRRIVIGLKFALDDLEERQRILCDVNNGKLIRPSRKPYKKRNLKPANNGAFDLLQNIVTSPSETSLDSDAIAFSDLVKSAHDYLQQKLLPDDRPDLYGIESYFDDLLNGRLNDGDRRVSLIGAGEILQQESDVYKRTLRGAMADALLNFYNVKYSLTIPEVTQMQPTQSGHALG